MKFTTTENVNHRLDVGVVSGPWFEYPGLEHEDSIWKYFRKYIKIWDFDNSDDEIHDFVFEDGKAYRLEYSYWRKYETEDDRQCSSVQIHEIAPEEANVVGKIWRDWI